MASHVRDKAGEGEMNLRPKVAQSDAPLYNPKGARRRSREVHRCQRVTRCDIVESFSDVEEAGSKAMATIVVDGMGRIGDNELHTYYLYR